jgi:uncharacterized protein YndB with AHSA1/START domain
MVDRTTTASDVLERQVRIAARAETIFPFLIDAEKMARWIGMSAELDAQPGGMFRLAMAGNNVVIGEFLEVDPYHRVVFTWGHEGEGSTVPPGMPPGSSTVEIDLIPDGDGTVVRLRHIGLPADQIEPHTKGWEHYLSRLIVAGEGGDPGEDIWEDAEDEGT